MSISPALPRPRVATRHNNFDALRLLGAFLVVVGHAYVLTGRGEDVPIVLGEEIQTLGVVVFFSLSGYLITGSWMRFRSLRPFLLARILRIGPALAVVVVLSALVLGPLFTTLEPTTYLASGGTWEYLQNAVLRIRTTLPGVFDGLPYPEVVNGSLWTLAPEFFCYLLLPLLVAKARPTTAAPLLASAAVVLLLLPRSPIAWTTLYGMQVAATAGLACYFFVGATLAVLVSTGRRILSTKAAVLALVAVAIAPLLGPSVHGLAALALLPYAVVSLGVAATPVVSAAGRHGDLSYGLYLWAFPVQQAVVELVGVLPVWVDIALVTAVSAVCAWVSWHVVEAPALRLRSRLRTRPPEDQPA